MELQESPDFLQSRVGIGSVVPFFRMALPFLDKGLFWTMAQARTGVLHRVEASFAATGPHDDSVVPLPPSFIAHLNHPIFSVQP